jgi:hypothetical protein
VGVYEKENVFGKKIAGGKWRKLFSKNLGD